MSRHDIPCWYDARSQPCPQGHRCRFIHSDECRQLFSVMGDELWAPEDRARMQQPSRAAHHAPPARLVSYSTAPPPPSTSTTAAKRSHPSMSRRGAHGAFVAAARQGAQVNQGRESRRDAHPVFAAAAAMVGPMHASRDVGRDRHDLRDGTIAAFQRYGRMLVDDDDDYDNPFVSYRDPFYPQPRPAFSRMVATTRRHAHFQDDDIDPDTMSYEELTALTERIGTVEIGVRNWRRWLVSAEDALRRLLPSGCRPDVANLPKDTNTDCPICLDDCLGRDEDDSDDSGDVVFVGAAAAPSSNHSRIKSIVMLPCRHLMHAGCVGEYFDKNHICPVCRLDLNVR